MSLRYLPRTIWDMTDGVFATSSAPDTALTDTVSFGLERNVREVGD
jgi:hypothetical protein